MERLVSEVSSSNPACHGGKGLRSYLSSSLTLTVGATTKLNASSSEPETVRNGLRYSVLGATTLADVMWPTVGLAYSLMRGNSGLNHLLVCC